MDGNPALASPISSCFPPWREFALAGAGWLVVWGVPILRQKALETHHGCLFLKGNHFLRLLFTRTHDFVGGCLFYVPCHMAPHIPRIYLYGVSNGATPPKKKRGFPS